MSNDEIIRLIYDVERDILNRYHTNVAGDINQYYGEMCGVHMMASLLIDKVEGIDKDGDIDD